LHGLTLLAAWARARGCCWAAGLPAYALFARCRLLFGVVIVVPVAARHAGGDLDPQLDDRARRGGDRVRARQRRRC
jgi:hypothetical protein